MSPAIVLACLLLPVAALSGWLLARWQISRGPQRTLHGHYFKGLNYLLNEEPDKAIEVFLKLAEVDQDTLEAHLALGNLFRRRGEVDRAIRTHENLLSKPELSASQRQQALNELADDYMRAGLLDRAEALFSEISQGSQPASGALESLLYIYQQEKDWPKAIVEAEKLGEVSGQRTGPVIAHYHCELARQALDQSERKRAVKHLKRARQKHPGSSRVRMLEAELQQEDGRDARAFQSLTKAIQLNPDLMARALPQLVAVAREAGLMGALKQQLEEWVEQGRGVSAALQLAQLMQERGDVEESVDFLLRYIHDQPNVRGLQALIAARRQHSDDEMLDALHTITRRLLENQPAYRCRECGFSGLHHHWLCPSCKRWNTTRAIRGVLGE